MTVEQFRREYPLVEEALQKESLRQRGIVYQGSHSNFQSYINGGFSWKNSTQRHIFWGLIYKSDFKGAKRLLPELFICAPFKNGIKTIKNGLL